MGSDTQRGSNAPRLAAAAASIARGAATGGVYGAAAEAAKAFFPELVKLAIALLCVVILLPMILFVALPNIFFGYDSAGAQDIIDFTASADELRGMYETIDLGAPSLLQKLADLILPDFTTDEGPLYEDYEVEKELGSINRPWIMAIASVRNKQDLFSMDAGSMDSLLLDCLDYSTSLSDGVLTITVRDRTPEALMDRLGFTDGEKDWARLLYSALADEQNIPYEDSDGAGYYGTDYGDITFTDAATGVVYYNQTDARWGGKSYGKSGTISSSGCGPTALAMCVASLTGNLVTPDEVCEWSVDHGYRVENVGTSHALITDGGAHYGLNVTGVGTSESAVVEALKSGKLVIAIMGPGHFTSCGHFIVLRGVTAEGNILVADPASVNRSNQAWSLRLITNELNRGAGAGGPYWVLSA